MVKFYFASGETGAPSGSESVQKIGRIMKSRDIERVLFSYYYCKHREEYLSDWESVFLDSGAYTAHTLGETINIEKYGDFIRRNIDEIDTYASLDVIGDAKETYRNQKRLERMGLEPLPTFHYGSDFSWLERYVDEGYDYIALGGLVGKHRKKKEKFVRVCRNYIPKGTKIHLFGVGNPDLLTRYKIYSADAINWLYGQKFGTMFYFNRGKMKKYKKDDFINKFSNMDDYNLRNKWNLTQWKKFSEWIEDKGWHSYYDD